MLCVADKMQPAEVTKQDGMLLCCRSSLMTISKDFENKSASSDQASHIWISVFHSDAKTFGEVTFHLQVKSFISKFLDWLVDAFFIWCSHPGIIHTQDSEHTGSMSQTFIERTFLEPQFQQHFAQVRMPGSWCKL